MGFGMNFFHIYKKYLHIYIYISKSVDVYNKHNHINTHKYIYICISKSVSVYTRYVLTKHRNNMNIG